MFDLKNHLTQDEMELVQLAVRYAADNEKDNEQHLRASLICHKLAVDIWRLNPNELRSTSLAVENYFYRLKYGSPSGELAEVYKKYPGYSILDLHRKLLMLGG